MWRMVPRVGDPAPQFDLEGVPPTPGGRYRLADQRGRVVVLAFYPGDFTPVCTRQLQSYEDQRQRLVQTGAVLWAISRRSIFLIDREGVIRYRHEEPLSLSYSSVDDIISALGASGLTPQLAASPSVH